MKTILKIMVLFSSLNLTAQVDTLSLQNTSKSRIQEFYLTVADFSPFSIHLKYKRQIGSRTFLRIGLTNLSVFKQRQEHSNSTEFPFESSGYSAGAQIGIEFRKSLSNKFSVFHGPNLRYMYSNSTSRLFDPSLSPNNQKNVSTRHLGSIPYSIGILFNITPNILISGEINPAISIQATTYANGTSPKLNSTSASFSFDNRFCLISIVYRL